MSFIDEWKENKEYFNLLELMSRLSNLFSDSNIPYLNYRVTENLFCKYYKAENLSRSDTAYDAKTNNYGIGIKTFTIHNEKSTEKVAEFNSIAPFLKQFHGYELALEIAKARNDRIELGKRLYEIKDGCYHIIGRIPGGLTVFNSEYPLINLNTISKVKENAKSLQFCDDRHIYTFNFSKSTLFKEFIVPKDNVYIPVDIIQDPYDVLKKLLSSNDYEGKYDNIVQVHEEIQKNISTDKKLTLGVNFVILPLYSVRDDMVPLRDGLNKWNANGRPRKANEVSIAIPGILIKRFPKFFPDIHHAFTLHLPNGKCISAKPCEPKGKGKIIGHAIQSNPNTDLGQWILRDVLQLQEGELATKELLDRFGFDSVILYKDSINDYRIDVCRTISYSKGLYNSDEAD